MENPWLDDHRAGDPDATRLMLEWDREHQDRHVRGGQDASNVAVVLAIIALALAVVAIRW